MTVETVEFAGEPGAKTADLFDLTGVPEPAPFKAPTFQADHKYGTYVAGRWPQFKVHATKGHARRAITASSAWNRNTTARSDSALYERVDHVDRVVEWVPVETYPAGAQLPWRTQSDQ